MNKIKYLIASISLIIALILSFIVFPKINESKYPEVFLVKVNKDIEINSILKKEDLEYVKVINYNLNPNYIKDINSVINKKITSKIFKDQLLVNNYFIKNIELKENVADKINNGKRLISISISDIALYNNDNLVNGDLVSIYGHINGMDIDLKTLNYVEVINIDKKDKETVISLLVNDIQANYLSLLQVYSKIHLALSYRGEEKEQLLLYQEKYFEDIKESKEK